MKTDRRIQEAATIMLYISRQERDEQRKAIGWQDPLRAFYEGRDWQEVRNHNKELEDQYNLTKCAQE